MIFSKITKQIEELKEQTAIINQILFNKRYIRLTKKFKNEGIEIVKNENGKNFMIDVDLIK